MLITNSPEGRPLLRNIPIERFSFGLGDTNLDLSVPAKKLSEFIHELSDDMIPSEDGSEWPRYVQNHRDHIELLALGDTDHFRGVCSNLFRTPLTFGYAQAATHFTVLRDRPEQRPLMAAIIIDKMLRLAEALGVRSIMSPEHGSYEQDVGDLDGLLLSIEESLDCDLTPPLINGALFGLQTVRGIFTERHFEAIYIAARLKKMGGVNSVIEIGGGCGYVAYYAHRMGIAKYTIIDLPSVTMVQYIILAGSLGSNCIGLRTQAPIRLVPCTLPNEVDWNVDMVLNVDSLPELSPMIAKGYVDNASHATRFFSINQESEAQNGESKQLPVRKLCSDGFAVLSRYPYFMRTGWVEELYRPKSARKAILRFCDAIRRYL
jgi:hypothetical protein